ncbi:MAG: nucleoside-diphosphate kinase [Candidatus Margulisiibacteriota bacterium]
MQEQSFFMIKPDGVRRGLEDDVLGYLRDANLETIKKKSFLMTAEDAEKLYAVHREKPFYKGLVNFITSGPVVAMVVEGEECIPRLREIMGATDPAKALSGTIRGDLKEKDYFTKDGTMKNIVHGSDSPENAKYEMAIFFDEGGAV